METDPIYLLQCMLCKNRKFIQHYENSPLTCITCGAVGSTEELPNLDEEIENLVGTLKTTNLEYSQEELQMIRIAEEILKKERDERSLEDMMSGLKVRPQIRPRRYQK